MSILNIKIGPVKDALSIILGIIGIASFVINIIQKKNDGNVVLCTTSRYNKYDQFWTFQVRIENIGNKTLSYNEPFRNLREDSTIIIENLDGVYVQNPIKIISNHNFSPEISYDSNKLIIKFVEFQKKEILKFTCSINPNLNVVSRFPTLKEAGHKIIDGYINFRKSPYDYIIAYLNPITGIRVFNIIRLLLAALFFWMFLQLILSYPFLIINYFLYIIWRIKHYKKFVNFILSDAFINCFEPDYIKVVTSLVPGIARRPFNCPEDFWVHIPVKRIKQFKLGRLTEKNFSTALIGDLVAIIFSFVLVSSLIT